MEPKALFTLRETCVANARLEAIKIEGHPAAYFKTLAILEVARVTKFPDDIEYARQHVQELETPNEKMETLKVLAEITGESSDWDAYGIASIDQPLSFEEIVHIQEILDLPSDPAHEEWAERTLKELGERTLEALAVGDAEHIGDFLAGQVRKLVKGGALEEAHEITQRIRVALQSDPEELDIYYSQASKSLAMGHIARGDLQDAFTHSQEITNPWPNVTVLIGIVDAIDALADK